MPRYVRLVKFTSEGGAHLKEIADRLGKGRQYLESMGGKFVDIYAVSGPYDLVAIIDAPSEDVVMKHGIWAKMTGLVDIVTMPALPVGEFLKVVAEVPKS
jgi:uncharacterized protein with GYD domain